MHGITRFRRPLRQLWAVNAAGVNPARRLCTDKGPEQESPKSLDAIIDNLNIPEKKPKVGGFAKSFQKFLKLSTQETETQEYQTFATLLRQSKFIDMGDPEGRLVTGKVFHVVGDDLYIDFGWKFYCVCRRPPKNGHLYVRGSIVRLQVKDLELSSLFMGATRDLTLLEADCILMGLIASPLMKQV